MFVHAKQSTSSSTGTDPSGLSTRRSVAGPCARDGKGEGSLVGHRFLTSPALLGIVASYADSSEVYAVSRALLAVSPPTESRASGAFTAALTSTLTEAVRHHGAGLLSIHQAQRTPAMHRAAAASNGSMLRHLPEALHDAELYAQAVQTHPDTLSIMPSSQHTPALRRSAVRCFGTSLKYVPYSLRTKALAILAGGSGGQFRDVPLKLWHDVDVVLAFLRGKAGDLHLIPRQMLDDEMLGEASVAGRLHCPLDALSERRRTAARSLAAVRSDLINLRHVPAAIRNTSREIWLAAVVSCGALLDQVPEQFKDDEIIAAALLNDIDALRFVPQEKCTRAMWIAALANSGRLFDIVPREMLRTDRELWLAILARDGTKIGAMIKMSDLRDPALYRTAVSQNGLALWFVPKQDITEDLVLQAVTQNGMALGSAPEHTRTEAVSLAAVRSDPDAVVYVPPKWRSEEIPSVVTAHRSSQLARPDEDGGALEFVPSIERDDGLLRAALYLDDATAGDPWSKDVAMQRISARHFNLHAVPIELRDAEVCKLALRLDQGALADVPQELRAEVEADLAAYRRRIE